MFKSVICFKDKELLEEGKNELRDFSDYVEIAKLDSNSKWSIKGECFLTISFEEACNLTINHPLKEEIEIYGYEYYLEMLRECA